MFRLLALVFIKLPRYALSAISLLLKVLSAVIRFDVSVLIAVFRLSFKPLKKVLSVVAFDSIELSDAIRLVVSVLMSLMFVFINPLR